MYAFYEHYVDLLLWENQESAYMLRNLNEENKACIQVSYWFTVYRTALTNFGETLTLDDVVANDEATKHKRQLYY